eukprot:2275116-Rhodomonas_salina.2
MKESGTETKRKCAGFSCSSLNHSWQQSFAFPLHGCRPARPSATLAHWHRTWAIRVAYTRAPPKLLLLHEGEPGGNTGVAAHAAGGDNNSTPQTAKRCHELRLRY